MVSEEELIEKPWMKDMDVDGGIVNGNTFCSTNRVWNPHPASLINFVKERTGGKEISQLNNYEYCAANLVGTFFGSKQLLSRYFHRLHSSVHLTFYSLFAT